MYADKIKFVIAIPSLYPITTHTIGTDQTFRTYLVSFQPSPVSYLLGQWPTKPNKEAEEIGFLKFHDKTNSAVQVT